jgi:predicted nucleotidyltransferase
LLFLWWQPCAGLRTQTNKLDKHLPEHLTANERTALKTLVDRLYQKYGDNLLRVVLFGSKARGDFDEESDLDVLVVLHLVGGGYWEHRRQISAIAYELELEYSVVFSLVVMDQLEYAEMRGANLLINRNIQQDGIELWTSPKSLPIWSSMV